MQENIVATTRVGRFSGGQSCLRNFLKIYEKIENQKIQFCDRCFLVLTYLKNDTFA
jgi:hypothetical protein